MIIIIIIIIIIIVVFKIKFAIAVWCIIPTFNREEFGTLGNE